MLLGAAKQLATDGVFDGAVHFIFQPNEEEGLGAQAMIDDGLFDRRSIDEVYGLHCVPGLAAGHFATRTGPMMTFEDNFVIRLAGVGGHSSAPHMTYDPLVAGAELVTALQTVVARSVSPMQSGVVSVTEFDTDGSRNVLPSNVVIRGDTRGLDPEVQGTIERRIREIVEGICAAHGLSYDFEYSHEFVVTVNSAEETGHAVAAARSVVGAAAVDSDCLPNTGSEDFARMLERRPGCYALIGNGTEGTNTLPLHHPSFDFNDEILPIGGDYWVTLTEMRLRS
jgi:hippurate hydrolase